MSKYLYSKDGETTEGPVSIDKILTMIRDCELPSSANICQEGTDAWFSVASMIQDNPSIAPRQRVIVENIQMNFGSMVVFMIKWAIASIPAAIILFCLAAICFIIFSAIAGSILGILK
jgi:hypothetical protein